MLSAVFAGVTLNSADPGSVSVIPLAKCWHAALKPWSFSHSAKQRQIPSDLTLEEPVGWVHCDPPTSVTVHH